MLGWRKEDKLWVDVYHMHVIMFFWEGVCDSWAPGFKILAWLCFSVSNSQTEEQWLTSMSLTSLDTKTINKSMPVVVIFHITLMSWTVHLRHNLQKEYEMIWDNGFKMYLWMAKWIRNILLTRQLMLMTIILTHLNGSRVTFTDIIYKMKTCSKYLLLRLGLGFLGHILLLRHNTTFGHLSQTVLNWLLTQLLKWNRSACSRVICILFEYVSMSRLSVVHSICPIGV